MLNSSHDKNEGAHGSGGGGRRACFITMLTDLSYEREGAAESSADVTDWMPKAKKRFRGLLRSKCHPLVEAFLIP